jgi:hypothetical protein
MDERSKFCERSTAFVFSQSEFSLGPKPEWRKSGLPRRPGCASKKKPSVRGTIRGSFSTSSGNYRGSLCRTSVGELTRIFFLRRDAILAAIAALELFGRDKHSWVDLI